MTSSGPRILRSAVFIVLPLEGHHTAGSAIPCLAAQPLTLSPRTIAGGFLEAEGLTPRHSVAPAGKSAIEGVVAGTVDVCQSAPSQGFGPLERGLRPPVVHFAQINEMDEFWLTGRAVESAYIWDTLRGKRVLVDHGGQPLAMFRYACHKRGIDYASIEAMDVPAGEMDAAFRRGEGDYVHQQGLDAIVEEAMLQEEGARLTQGPRAK
jgi:ABC-type nitrate/sulfonate/bicarbonate transport system substrate-binding protein